MILSPGGAAMPNGGDHHRDHYVVLFRLHGAEHYALWYTNDEDGLLADERRIWTWPTESAARVFALENGLTLAAEPAAEFDFDAVRLHVAGTRSLPPRILLDVWNMLGDVATSVENEFFQALDRKHGDAYNRVFAVTDVLGVFGPGAEPLSPEEDAATRDVLRAGLEMLERCL